MNSSNRIVWADQAKGLAIFLMVYAHNFPFCETYIYTFHMPLFFFVSGLFHPKKVDLTKIKKRAKQLLIPYFVWSLLLYFFWLVIGRNYGTSADKNYDAINNFIGVFYAQGDNDYMNWGIPMWFIPCIFLTFVIFGFVNRISNKYLHFLVILLLVAIGFIYASNFNFKLPWSIDIACVSLIFYALAYHIKSVLVKLKFKSTIFWLLGALVIHFVFVFLNPKVDMYRAIYNNEFLFAINGISGTIVVVLLLKLITLPKIVSYLGNNTIVILALHLRALTFIKIILLVFGISNFEFNEWTKFFISILQILIILPLIPLINRYTPILNGRIK